MDESIKKQILITGKNSYIGTMIKKYLDQFPDRYNVHLLDVRDAEWEKFDFSKWNVVINVTGIAHKSEDEVVSGDYYKINRDLCLKIAERAKEKNVSHFIQMSTMAVFGDSIEKIEKSSPLNAKTHYGLSKLQADYILQLMEDSQFHVCIVRPPMVYGKDSKGNYSKLSNFIKKIPVFIKYENKRSILYIKNLSIYIKYIIDCNIRGIVFPQNSEYVSTNDLVNEIAKQNGKKIIFIPNLLGKYITKHTLFNKIFGNLYYDVSIDDHKLIGHLIPFEESIKEIEYL